jgi:hypothetical protein
LIEGRYESAVEEFSKLRGSGPFAGYNFSDQMLDLEIAFCKAKSGDVNAAIEEYSKIRFDSIKKLDSDEQLAIAWMRFTLAEIDDRFGPTVDHRSALNEISSIVVESRLALRQKLANWVACN